MVPTRPWSSSQASTATPATAATRASILASNSAREDPARVWLRNCVSSKLGDRVPPAPSPVPDGGVKPTPVLPSSVLVLLLRQMVRVPQRGLRSGVIRKFRNERQTDLKSLVELTGVIQID